jgi:recombination protein RecR
MLPDEIKKFIDTFSSLPSIGARQATRLAFKLINNGRAKIEETAKAVSDLKKLQICADCFFVHSNNKENLCNICKDQKRRRDLIMIVEKETDLISLEKTGKFNGRYLVIGELTKIGNLESMHKLKINHLKKKIREEIGIAEEIIIAFNPSAAGDLNASIIAKELTGLAKKITRLGRGIPTGGEIEFADEETLEESLKRRN